MEQNALEIKGLCKNFHVGSLFFGKQIHAVENVSLALPDDRPWVFSIVGESGSGKTTLAKMILGLLDASAGDIQLHGKSISLYKSGKKEFYKKVQTIAQNPFSAFSARRTVDCYLYETAMNLAGCKTRDEATALITKLLASVGLELRYITGKYSNQFSGGELQRVSIVRAMLPGPAFIVADEPVAMIDASLRMNIVNIFKSLKEEYGVNFIYITHDLSTAYYISDYVAIMYRGNIIEFGPGQEVLSGPLHPYTDLLIHSIPAVGKKWEESVALPDFEAKEYSRQGCKLLGRCPCAMEICQTIPPKEVQITGAHRVLCHRYPEKNLHEGVNTP